MKNDNIDPYNEENWDEKEYLWDIYKPVILNVIHNIFSSIIVWMIGLYFLMDWFIEWITMIDNFFSPTTLIPLITICSIILLGLNRGVLKWVKWMNTITVIIMISFSIFLYTYGLNSPSIYEKVNNKYEIEETNNMLIYTPIDTNYNRFYFNKNDSIDITKMELCRYYKIGFFNDTITTNTKYLVKDNVSYISNYFK